MLRLEHGMSAHRSLPPVVCGIRRRKPRPYEVLRVAANSRHALLGDVPPIRIGQPEARPELRPRKFLKRCIRRHGVICFTIPLRATRRPSCRLAAGEWRGDVHLGAGKWSNRGCDYREAGVRPCPPGRRHRLFPADLLDQLLEAKVFLGLHLAARRELRDRAISQGQSYAPSVRIGEVDRISISIIPSPPFESMIPNLS